MGHSHPSRILATMKKAYHDLPTSCLACYVETFFLNTLPFQGHSLYVCPPLAHCTYGMLAGVFTAPSHGAALLDHENVSFLIVMRHTCIWAWWVR